MKITIIGTGYVGLPAGACFAEIGHDVICVDKNESKINLLNKGEIPLFEPGLSELVVRNADQNRLSFTTDLTQAVKAADIIFLAVGTPTDPKTGHADLTYINEAAKEIALSLNSEDGYKVIAIKSTVPVETNDVLEKMIQDTNPNLSFDVVSIPEFLREGKAVEDFMNPERIIIGVESDKAKNVVSNLYSSFTKRDVPILYTNRKTAELIKYASNCFLGMKISFINEMADFCETVGADIRDISRGIGLDSRIGSKFLNPGPGFGGSCFPKDMLELITTSKEKASPLSLIETAIKVNCDRAAKMAEKLRTALNGKKKIGVLGLAFKAETDDIRYSPALALLKNLKNTDLDIVAYDPQAMENAKQEIPNLVCVDSVESATKDRDAVVILTEWDDFKHMDLNQLRASMSGDLIVDFRNLFDPDVIKKSGFNYVPVGYEG